MRRAKEIVAWKRGDVRHVHSGPLVGGIEVFVRSSKTDQAARGKWIPIEPAGGALCVVRLVCEYMRCYPGVETDPLFGSVKTKEALAPASVSHAVKEMAAHAGLGAGYSGHSVRIGGAVAALAGGMTEPQIRAIGDWTGNALLLYLRADGSAIAGASRAMGFDGH